MDQTWYEYEEHDADFSRSSTTDVWIIQIFQDQAQQMFKLSGFFKIKHNWCFNQADFSRSSTAGVLIRLIFQDQAQLVF